jgi:hypothetical protein
MKTCFKCKRLQPIDNFYPHPQMGDGRLNKCKECTKSDVRTNRAKRLDHYREYDKLRFKEPERRKAHAVSLKKHRQRNPQKSIARVRTARAIRSGQLIRQPCEVCGNAKSEAHHPDYSKPLDVRWLCRVHHRMEHGAYTEPIE